MVNICIYGLFLVNGVVVLYIDILKNIEFNDFYKLYLFKFNNKINGIIYCRWLLYINYELIDIFDNLLGSKVWYKDLSLIKGLE